MTSPAPAPASRPQPVTWPPVSDWPLHEMAR